MKCSIALFLQTCEGYQVLQFVFLQSLIQIDHVLLLVITRTSSSPPPVDGAHVREEVTRSKSDGSSSD